MPTKTYKTQDGKSHTAMLSPYQRPMPIYYLDGTVEERFARNFTITSVPYSNLAYIETQDDYWHIVDRNTGVWLWKSNLQDKFKVKLHHILSDTNFMKALDSPSAFEKYQVYLVTTNTESYKR